MSSADQIKPRIIITGGAGFIGSHITDELLQYGYQILIIDNYSTGKKENNSPHERLTIAEGDICNREFVDRIFDSFSPSLVIHAAASYRNPGDWEEDISTNIIGTVNIIRASKKCRISRLIYLQTSLSYGLVPVQNPITLDHPFFSGKYSGGSSYAISKTTGEMYIELSGIEFISFRLANTYGPRNLSGPLPAFYKRLTSGEKVVVTDTRRDFIYVADLVACLVKAVNGSGSKGYYHLGTGKDHSVKELYYLAAKSLGVDPDQTELVEYREKGEDDVATLLLDVRKTEHDFNWIADTALAKGVKESIDWYIEHGLKETYTHLTIFNKN